MARGGHNRLSAEVKKAKGTLRPDRLKNGPVPSALTSWPKPPPHFSPAESVAWERLGGAVMELGSVSRADLLFCERVAQVSARVDEALKDPDLKLTSLNALLNIEARLRIQLGISPQARGGVSTLAPEKQEEDEDPDAEFGPGA